MRWRTAAPQRPATTRPALGSFLVIHACAGTRGGTHRGVDHGTLRGSGRPRPCSAPRISFHRPPRGGSRPCSVFTKSTSSLLSRSSYRGSSSQDASSAVATWANARQAHDRHIGSGCGDRTACRLQHRGQGRTPDGVEAALAGPEQRHRDKPLRAVVQRRAGHERGPRPAQRDLAPRRDLARQHWRCSSIAPVFTNRHSWSSTWCAVDTLS